eukprot:1244702-Rhodomonas_salina.1
MKGMLLWMEEVQMRTIVEHDEVVCPETRRDQMRRKACGGKDKSEKKVKRKEEREQVMDSECTGSSRSIYIPNAQRPHFPTTETV